MGTTIHARVLQMMGEFEPVSALPLSMPPVCQRTQLTHRIHKGCIPFYDPLLALLNPSALLQRNGSRCEGTIPFSVMITRLPNDVG